MRMTDEKRAIMGDREAAKRLTEAGGLAPCPMCGLVPVRAHNVGKRWTVSCIAEEMEMLEGMK